MFYNEITYTSLTWCGEWVSSSLCNNLAHPMSWVVHEPLLLLGTLQHCILCACLKTVWYSSSSLQSLPQALGVNTKSTSRNIKQKRSQPFFTPCWKSCSFLQIIWGLSWERFISMMLAALTLATFSVVPMQNPTVTHSFWQGGLYRLNHRSLYVILQCT